ncbi:flagellin [Alsobacter sp. SYSU M60028]|uniref:Flagellin n=2 Tax=Alsobacter ponti TaxID=2962936 RepID=A0ABT1LFP5_9HYPH|nr:flagellin [Alsobacter ponti]
MSQTIQNRLATGKKVNSAMDNPASFFVAAGLQNRAGDLGRLLDDMGQGTKVLEAADKGITAIKKLIETAQGTLRQVLQSAATNKIVGNKTVAAADDLITDLKFTAGDKIEVAVDGGTAVTAITIAAGDTVQDVIDGINNNATLNATAGASVKASLNSDGKIEIESMDNKKYELSVTAASGSTATVKNLIGSSGTVAQENTTRTTLAGQFDQLLTQIDQLQKDASYNGVNLLGGNALKVTFNEDGSSSLTITGVTFDSAGLGLSASSSATNGFQRDANVQSFLDKLTTASNTLRAQASTFGANLSVVQNRQDFTKGLISTLTTGSDALTLADQNEEGATLLALQTRQQLSQTALSLSNQADQAVLRMFG